MNKHISTNVFNTSYLKELQLSPEEAQYLFYLNENIPDMSRSGIADPHLKIIINDAVDALWSNIANTLQQRQNLIEQNIKPLPDVFDSFEHARLAAFKNINSNLKRLNEQNIKIQAFEDQNPAYMLRSILGGIRHILNEPAQTYKSILEGWTWNNVKYDQQRNILKNIFKEHDHVVIPNLDQFCKEHGLAYVTCPSTMKNSMLNKYLDSIDDASQAIDAKFNWTDKSMFGCFGCLGIELHTYSKSFNRGTQDCTGKMTLASHNPNIVIHEWMHFYDYMIGRTNNSVVLESEAVHNNLDSPLSVAMETLVRSISPSDITKPVDYKRRDISTTLKDFVEALKHKDLYALKSNLYDLTDPLNKDRYWNQRCEKLARAFEAYITDGYHKISQAYPPMLAKSSVNNAFDVFAKETGPIMESHMSEHALKWYWSINQTSRAAIEKKPDDLVKKLYHAPDTSFSSSGFSI